MTPPSVQLTAREAAYLSVLAGKHPRATASGAAGLTASEERAVVARLGLRFDESDRLRDPASIVSLLAQALRQTLEALAAARREVDAVRQTVAATRGLSARALGVDSTTIREWADANGVPCSRSGRMSRETLQAYLDAHPGSGS